MYRMMAVLMLLASCPVAIAQSTPEEVKAQKEYILANYTKFEHHVSMRDGVKLFTVVYIPKYITRDYPFLIHRTPYGVGPYGVDSYTDRLSSWYTYAKSGYIMVNQDVRGKMKSEGQFVDMRPHIPNKKGQQTDESSDAYDTIEWLIKNIPNHNGRAGILGVSYPGFYAACAMIDAHPALKAVSPQAPVIDMFDGDDWRHNGALLLSHNFGFEQFFNKMTPLIYRRPGSTV